jgi:putative DNA primase/helicase
MPVEMIYEDRFGRDPDKPSPQTLRLRGLRLAVMTEPEGSKKLSPAKVKSFTSGTDKIGGRALHEKDAIYFDPTHTLVMHGNEVPKVMGHQGPFYERLRLIPFRARFVRNQDEVDPDNHVFLQKPRAEMERLLREHDKEMLSFLVRCARKALAAGDMPTPPDAVLNETRSFRDEEDMVGRYLRQCTEAIPDSFEQAKDLYRSFRYWCREEIGLSAKSTPSLKAISGDLRAQPHIERVEKRTVLYYGIKILQEWIPDDDWK